MEAMLSMSLEGDNQNEYTKVYNATVALHNEGVFPAPKALLTRLGLKATTDIRVEGRLVAGARLNAVKSAARAEALTDLGYTRDWRTGRWTLDA